MIRKLIVLLSILILIFGWINSDSVAVSESKLEEVLNIFSSVSQDKRELGAIVLNEYLKDMDNGVENLKNDIDDFLSESQKEKLNSMGYSLNEVKQEMDILKSWTLSERKTLISCIKWGDTAGIRSLVNSVGQTQPSEDNKDTAPTKTPNSNQTSTDMGESSEDNTIKEEQEEKLLEVLFEDIEAHKNKESIVYLAERGIIKGKTSEKFDPNGELTRAEFVMLIQSVLDIKPIEDEEMPFKDVEKGKWYSIAVKSAYDNKIIKGTSDTTFSPDKQVTREAMVSIIMRILNDKGITFTLGNTDKDISMYSDREQISSWAIQDMFYGVKYGIIEARTESLLNPSDFATRGEAAEIIKKLYDLTKSKEKN